MADFAKILKYNPYHDRRGRFTSKGGLGGNIAADLHARAKEVEPMITRDMQASVTGGRLEGLEYAVKGQDSLTRKINDEAAEYGLHPSDVARNIGDSVRYTVEATPANYSVAVTATLHNLKAKGYELVEFRNTWGQGKAYQGINTNLRHQRTGTVIELQFHTPQSFDMKQNVNHRLYEEARLKTTPKARVDELNAIMKENQKRVEIPHGAPQLRG